MVKSRRVRWVENLVFIAVIINIQVFIDVNIRRGTPKRRWDKNIKVSEK
jgi:hypothetical protein